MSENLEQIECAKDDKEEKRMCFIDDKIKERRFEFAIQCLRKVIKIEKNIVLCPNSLYDGLCAMLDCNINNLKELLKLKNLSGDTLKKYMHNKRKKELDKCENASDAYYIADSLCWIENNSKYSHLKINHCFDKFEQIHFTESPQVQIREINAIMKEYISGIISNPVELNENTTKIELILTNTFRLDERKFEAMPIASSSGKSAKRIFLERKCRSSFSPEFKMHVSEFPHEKSDTSLYILLPASFISKQWKIKENIRHDDLRRLTDHFSDYENIMKLRELLKTISKKEDDTDLLTCPVFELEISLKIHDLLKAFEKSSGSSRNRSKEHIIQGVHRACVKVSEENTKAGGINVICKERAFLPSPRKVYVDCDYPFIWFIYEKEIQEILFIGVCEKSDKF
ncbi:leukocyte elastase inhibitor-like [Nylanderia fulva]|uniref:leukocyte elastase inhibitor-like n=1 Tax=Nylanderia fulva TaxID=613905 RepID=UPI0010FB3CB3|nr:leukocyte elastase inhibitor-like [Nylanderia fulva]